MTIQATVDFVLVGFRNSSEELARLVAALVESAGNIDVSSKAFVVLNDDSPWTPMPQVEVIQGQGNVGFAAGVSLGVHASTADFVVMVNPDCEPDVEQFSKFLTELRPGCGVIVPLLCDAGGRVDFTPYENWTYTLGRQISAVVTKRFLLHSTKERLPAFVKVPGAFIGMERVLALRFGSPFDSAYFLYGEDRDLTNRLNRAAVPMRLLREVTITHIGGGSGTTVSALVERSKSDSAMRIAYRRYGKVGAILAAVDLIGVGWIKQTRGDRGLLPPRLWAIRRWSSKRFDEPGPLAEANFIDAVPSINVSTIESTQ